MLNKLLNISSVIILAFTLLLRPKPPEGPSYVFWSLFGLLLASVGSSIWLYARRRRRAARIASCRNHYLIDTACLLNMEALGRNFDPETGGLLTSLVNQGCQDGLALRPNLQKALKRLKAVSKQHPDDPGPPAFSGWGLVLLSRISGRDAALASGGEYPEEKLWNLAVGHYRKAVNLAPQEGTIPADWARALEERGWLISAEGENPSVWFTEALKQYEAAALADVELKSAWRGQGRVVARQVMELGREPAFELLGKAVGLYEQARGDYDWGWDFYDEFAQVVFTLAQYHPSRAVHFFRYSARLYLMAAEMNGDSPAAYIQAGRAFHQAGFAAQDLEAEQADSLYRESLECFRTALVRQPDDAYALLWTARTLSSLYSLAESGKNYDAEESSGRESDLWLSEALEMCAQAASIAPGEEVYSDWANILSLKAENGGTDNGELWAATARKYASAIAHADESDERSAINWHNWAYALCSLAETRPLSEGRFKLLERAAAKYEKAAALNGNNIVTLKNWGDVLGDMADLADDPLEVDKLIAAAEEKFETATRLYPGRSGAWRRWSMVIQKRARGERNPTRRRELWQAALEKLERGVQAEPDSGPTWIMWGQVLSELYWEGAEYERPLLVSGIVEKYEKALALDSDDPDTWILLGRARLEASEIPSELSVCGSELENAAAAVEAFKSACALAPEQAGRWADWGRALFRLSQILDNEASAMAVLKEAGEKYETAVALEPESGEHHTGLGHIFYQWAWRLEEPELKRGKFNEAYDHCAQAGRYAPHDPVVWRNWGKVTEALASVEKDPLKSYDWQNEADEKFYHADIIDSTLSRDRRH